MALICSLVSYIGGVFINSHSLRKSGMEAIHIFLHITLILVSFRFSRALTGFLKSSVLLNIVVNKPLKVKEGVDLNRVVVFTIVLD